MQFTGEALFWSVLFPLLAGSALFALLARLSEKTAESVARRALAPGLVALYLASFSGIFGFPAAPFDPNRILTARDALAWVLVAVGALGIAFPTRRGFPFVELLVGAGVWLAVGRARLRGFESVPPAALLSLAVLGAEVAHVGCLGRLEASVGPRRSSSFLAALSFAASFCVALSGSVLLAQVIGATGMLLAAAAWLKTELGAAGLRTLGAMHFGLVAASTLYSGLETHDACLLALSVALAGGLPVRSTRGLVLGLAPSLVAAVDCGVRHSSKLF